ncbi:MAG: AbrB/MazE/SpoVT family DNA-binding domain-containing protein [Candidatus Brockarchaeota archaeon]|nr:AbrB/MazE/SpoVT family DNA-binding domain-containing protein [Candidatus Brockarchaeota archaeon]MBO3808425.1 AbrB/MazE/SpoVT family DNA-binding domain-containing protein [Candidatus Brockarchaeota archaeon]
MSKIIQIRKRNALYLPKEIIEKMDIREGDRFIVEVSENSIVLRPVKKFKMEEYWSEMRPEEVEEVGEEITRQLS